MLLKEKGNHEEYVAIQSNRAAGTQNSNTFFKDFKDAKISFEKDWAFLDIGCRLPAYTVKDLNKQGYEAYGCDIGSMCQQIWDDTSPTICHRLRQFDIHEGNPFPYKMYDVVSASHVIEHCYDPILVRQVIDSFLKFGGYIHTILPIEIESNFMRHEPHLAMFASHDEHKQYWQFLGYELVYESYKQPNSVTIFRKKHY